MLHLPLISAMPAARTVGCLVLSAASMYSTMAAAAQPAPVPILSGGSMLQMLLGLALVLALVLACAWIMKRLQTRTGGSGGIIRVVAGAAVGQRERVVLLEIAGNWLVIGVAPGRVSALHTMPCGELPQPLAQDQPQNSSVALPFAEWLKRVLEQRRAR